MVEAKHTKLKFPKWDVETIISYAVGNEANEAMSLVQYAKLEAEVALGIKALDQQPRQLDPVSFKAATVAYHMLSHGAHSAVSEHSKNLEKPPIGSARQDIEGLIEDANQLQAFADQSSEYLKGVEINFGGPQVGQRR